MDNAELEQLRAENQQLRQLNRFYHEAMAFTGHQWSNEISLLNLSVTRLEKDSQQTLDDQQQQALLRIQHSAAAILRVARYYLYLPHLEDKNFHLNRIFVAPANDIFKPLLFSYTDLLVAKRQTTAFTVSRPDLLVWADRELLITACQNLLHLAIEAGAPDNKITLHVLERGSVDEFSIWNRGTHRSEKDLKQFTNPCDTLINNHEYPSREQIGLSLARLLIEAHEGTFSVEASPTIGIKFVFTLPKRQMIPSQRFNQVRGTR